MPVRSNQRAFLESELSSLKEGFSSIAVVKGKPARQAQIRSLTGVRFIAAVWVVLFHFREEIARLTKNQALMGVVEDGHHAVPFFFILSGFILSHTYFTHYSLRDHGAFVLARFARLWPVHLITLLALVVYALVIYWGRGRPIGDNFAPSALLPELLMLRCWSSTLLIWNYPAWSIHAEWFAYIFLFPLCAILLRKVRQVPVLLSLLGGLAVSHTAFLETSGLGKLPEIIFLFVAGSALLQLRTLLGQWPGERSGEAGAFLFLITFGFEGQLALTIRVLSFMMIIFGLSYERGPLNSILSSPLLVYGGAISYSIYMCHAVVHKVLSVGFNMLPQTYSFQIAHLAMLLIGTVLVASVLYRFLEVPSARAIRVWGTQQKNARHLRNRAGETVELHERDKLVS